MTSDEANISKREFILFAAFCVWVQLEYSQTLTCHDSRVKSINLLGTNRKTTSHMISEISSVCCKASDTMITSSPQVLMKARQGGFRAVSSLKFKALYQMISNIFLGPAANWGYLTLLPAVLEQVRGRGGSASDVWPFEIIEWNWSQEWILSPVLFRQGHFHSWHLCLAHPVQCLTLPCGVWTLYVNVARETEAWGFVAKRL